MAEIKIEKKTPVWPWVIFVLLIIAGLLYFFVFNDDDGTDNQQEDRTEQTTTGEALNSATVSAYVGYIKSDTATMGLDHEYTNEAFSRLTNATRAMADGVDYDIQRDLDKARTHAEKITNDPFETTHANEIRAAAGILAGTLQNIQQEAFPEMENQAAAVRVAASSIETDLLTLDQKMAVKNFFREAADLLDKMNSNPSKT